VVFVANFTSFPIVEIFENRFRFDKVTESLKVGTFFETQCISFVLLVKCALCFVLQRES